MFNRQTRVNVPSLFPGGGRGPVTMPPVTANIAPPTHAVPLDPGLRRGGMLNERTTRPIHREATASPPNARKNQTNARKCAAALPRRRPGPSCDDARNSGHQPANTRSATGPRPLPGRNAQKSGRHAQSIEKRRHQPQTHGRIRQTRAPPLFPGGGRGPVTMTPVTANIAPPTHTVPLDPGLRREGMHKKADDTPTPARSDGHHAQAPGRISPPASPAPMPPRSSARR